MCTLYIYADFDWLDEPLLVGELGYESLRGSDSYSFKYDNDWLRQYGGLFLSADINNYPGLQYTQLDRDIFGCFGDALPDRWGRISRNAINSILKDYQVRGIECIYRKKRDTPPVDGKITGEVEAHLIALACHAPPEGYCRWTLRLLSERMVQMNYIDSISHTSVGKVLRENDLKPHLVEQWCIPREQSADFAACMEDVLEVYSRPYDERYPVVCMDEKPLQLLGEARQGRRKGNGAMIQDCEYVRNGTCSIFLFTEPLAGFRHAEALEHRKKADWAGQMKWLADEIYPGAEKIILVCDNLNTHDKSSFYEAFPPAEALRLAKRFEFHYTPRHGSWLNIAEIELSALSKQCLGKRRIDNLDDLNAELEKWHTDRNNRQKGVDWQFTNEEARAKLKHLYPLVNF